MFIYLASQSLYPDINFKKIYSFMSSLNIYDSKFGRENIAICYKLADFEVEDVEENESDKLIRSEFVEFILRMALNKFSGSKKHKTPS
jgi:hypothetical protein